MRNEDLEHALRRARDATRPLHERHVTLLDAIKRLKLRQGELETKGRPDEADEYLANAKSLYDVLMEQGSLGPRLKEACELESALTFLPISWYAAMPGKGMGGVYFFVRTYRIEEGQPVAYDPFWIETCVRDRYGDLAELKALHASWASGADLRPGGTGPDDPCIGIARPFGPATDAATVPCGSCAASAYVVGWKELVHWIEPKEDDWSYRQALYALCLACPRLTLLAERVDPEPLDLHP